MGDELTIIIPSEDIARSAWTSSGTVVTDFSEFIKAAAVTSDNSPILIAAPIKMERRIHNLRPLGFIGDGVLNGGYQHDMLEQDAPVFAPLRQIFVNFLPDYGLIPTRPEIDVIKDPRRDYGGFYGAGGRKATFHGTFGDVERPLIWWGGCDHAQKLDDVWDRDPDDPGESPRKLTDRHRLQAAVNSGRKGHARNYPIKLTSIEWHARLDRPLTLHKSWALIEGVTSRDAGLRLINEFSREAHDFGWVHCTVQLTGDDGAGNVSGFHRCLDKIIWNQGSSPFDDNVHVYGETRWEEHSFVKNCTWYSFQEGCIDLHAVNCATIENHEVYAPQKHYKDKQQFFFRRRAGAGRVTIKGIYVQAKELKTVFSLKDGFGETYISDVKSENVLRMAEIDGSGTYDFRNCEQLQLGKPHINYPDFVAGGIFITNVLAKVTIHNLVHFVAAHDRTEAYNIIDDAQLNAHDSKLPVVHDKAATGVNEIVVRKYDRAYSYETLPIFTGGEFTTSVAKNVRENPNRPNRGRKAGWWLEVIK